MLPVVFPLARTADPKFCTGIVTAFAVWSKRLEEGTHAITLQQTARQSTGAKSRRKITAQELGALLSGIDLSRATRRKHYGRSV